MTASLFLSSYFLLFKKPVMDTMLNCSIRVQGRTEKKKPSYFLADRYSIFSIIKRPIHKKKKKKKKKKKDIMIVYVKLDFKSLNAFAFQVTEHGQLSLLNTI